MIQNHQTRLTIAYFSAFFVLGMTAAVLGPSLLRLADQTGASLGRVSVFFPVRAGAYLAGSWISGTLYDRYRGHRLLVMALIIMGLTLALVPLVPVLEVVVGVLVVLGLGMGLLDVGCNTLLIWAHRSRTGPYLNGLHFFYGLGSFAAPLILAQAYRLAGGVRAGYWILAGLTLPVVIQLIPLPSPSQGEDQGTEAPEQDPSKGSRALTLQMVFLSLFLFAYVGMEVGFGGWIFTFGVQSDLVTEVTGGYLTSAFWGAFTMGRLLSVPLASRFQPRVILTADLGGAVVCLASLSFWSSSPVVVWAGTVGLGLAIASVFPTALSLAERRLSLSGKLTSWFFVSGGLGAVVVPWLIGKLVEGAGPVMIPQVLLGTAVLSGGVYGIYLWVSRAENLPRGENNRTRVG